MRRPHYWTTDTADPTRNHVIWSAATDGSQPSVHIGYNSGGNYRFSPDGQWIYFLSSTLQDGESEKGTAYYCRLDGSELRNSTRRGG